MPAETKEAARALATLLPPGCGSWREVAAAELAASGRRIAMGAQRLLLVAIRCYQLVVSPLLGERCRFHPSCSRYAATAIRAYGPWRGSALAVWRLLRCHPWSVGGLDPVPGRFVWEAPGGLRRNSGGQSDRHGQPRQ